MAQGKSRPRSLVTGACGFIGSHMVEILADAGHEIIAADHPAAWETDSLMAAKYPSLVRKLSAETFSMDLGDPDSLGSLPLDVDYVFHIAAVFSYAATWKQLHTVNVEGTRAMAKRYAGSRRLKRWVQWGAGGVYGLPSKREVEVFTEEVAPEPANNYLRSKWQQEFLIMEMGRKGLLPYSIIRPTTVYGERGGYGSRRLFMEMKDASVIAVPRNLQGHIPFIHVRDVARAGLHLAITNSGRNEVFNVSDDTDMTNVEYLQSLARMLNKPFVKLPPIPLGEMIAALQPVLKLQLVIARDLLRVTPLVEPDLLAYFSEDFRFSNDKLKATGFQFQYPDARLAFVPTLRWYLENNGNS